MNNAYVSVQTADDYHDARQTADRWHEFTDAEKAQRLLSASDVLDNLAYWRGVKVSDGQHRAFPRWLDKQASESGVVPDVPLVVLAAVCELALLDNINGALPKPAKLQNVRGVMLKSGECAADCASGADGLRYVMRLLSPWIERNGVVLRG